MRYVGQAQLRSRSVYRFPESLAGGNLEVPIYPSPCGKSGRFWRRKKSRDLKVAGGSSRRGLSNGRVLLRSFPLLCGLIALVCGTPVFAASGTDAPHQLSLVEYVTLALRDSDSARNIQDSLSLTQLGTEGAEFEFETRLVPVAQLRLGANQGTQTLGLEAQRTIEFGTTFATGVASQKIKSDNFEVTNPYSTRAFVRISQGLFRRWGKTYNRAPLTVAELEQQKDKLLAHRERQSLIVDAVQRFYATLLSQRLVEKSKQALIRAAKHLEAADSRQSAGLVSKVDVYRAELARLAAENALKDRWRAQRSNAERLHELLALRDVEVLRLEDQIIAMTPVIPDDWEEALPQYRSDWRAHLTDIEIAELSLYRAERNLHPDLALSLVLERQGFGDSYSESTNLDQPDWSVQLELRSSLHLTEEKMALTRERIRRSKIARQTQALKRSIYREAREAFEDLAAEERRHRIGGERLEQAKLALELSQIRYQRGLSSNLDVLDAEAAYSQAELDILRTLVAYNVASVRLGHALGILDLAWMEASLQPHAELQATSVVTKE